MNYNKFQIKKKWQINGHKYEAFSETPRGIIIEHAQVLLENLRDLKAMEIGNDVDIECDYDNSLFGKFSMIRNGVKFTYEIEEVQESKSNIKDFTKYKHKVCFN